MGCPPGKTVGHGKNRQRGTGLGGITKERTTQGGDRREVKGGKGRRREGSK